MSARRRDFDSMRRTRNRVWALGFLVAAVVLAPNAASAVTGASVDARATSFADAMAQRLTELAAVDNQPPTVACSTAACTVNEGEWTFALPADTDVSYDSRPGGAWTLTVSTNGPTITHDSSSGRTVTEPRTPAVVSLTQPLVDLGRGALQTMEGVWIP